MYNIAWASQYVQCFWRPLKVDILSFQIIHVPMKKERLTLTLLRLARIAYNTYLKSAIKLSLTLHYITNIYLHIQSNHRGLTSTNMRTTQIFEFSIMNINLQFNTQTQIPVVYLPFNNSLVKCFDQHPYYDYPTYRRTIAPFKNCLHYEIYCIQIQTCTHT